MIVVVNNVLTRLSKFLHDVGQHCAARGDKHERALNFIVIIYQALHCQIHQYASHHPDGADREKSP